ncbi:MAG TPA: sigma 54-interacting transcriptional regulator [Pyrinomonadaceae bacterium]|nr:sigma 54-interacting transcriptional regulator [Pyrinomonadaceae bacterium]
MLSPDMDPQLIAISGSLKGTTFALTAEEVSIGRDTSNSVSLNDPSVSRRHCLIKRTRQSNPDGPDRFTILDLESYNGTFVNSLPVIEQPLAQGDQIALGDLLFLFLAHESDAAVAAVQFEEGDLITRSTVRLQREDAFYLRPDKVLPDSPSESRVARERNVLLKISTTLTSIRNVRDLQHRLLELILEVIPAEREAILLADESREELVSLCGWNRLTGLDDATRVSKTITNQVLREEVALLSNDIFENENIGGAPSLIESRVCSLLCVPLVAFEKPLGVIYLDTSDPTARFDEGHLRLLTSIAGISALALKNAIQIEGLTDENARLQSEIRLEHAMIGEGVRMREVYTFLSKVAPTDSTVLILGESGTGKELAAQAIHLNSARATKPFVAINCATLTESLLEDELCGHEKGAFTGAITQKRGKLEIADGGTLFLDEVGELPPVIQANLLRVLQTREFERLGGTRTLKTDIRVIAATNRNLEAAIKQGEFREDLFYRLNVLSIVMPALRDRREDISLLATYFVGEFSKKCKRKVTGVSPEARRLLHSYDWPGNVRELENAIERAIVLGSTDLIVPDDLPEALCESGPAENTTKADYHEAIKEAKRRLISEALKQAQGNYTEAAKQLGIHPNNLHRLISSLDLRTTNPK